jgi:hypothetical protein
MLPNHHRESNTIETKRDTKENAVLFKKTAQFIQLDCLHLYRVSLFFALFLRISSFHRSHQLLHKF